MQEMFKGKEGLIWSTNHKVLHLRKGGTDYSPSEKAIDRVNMELQELAAS